MGGNARHEVISIGSGLAVLCTALYLLLYDPSWAELVCTAGGDIGQIPRLSFFSSRTALFV